MRDRCSIKYNAEVQVEIAKSLRYIRHVRSVNNLTRLKICRKPKMKTGKPNTTSTLKLIDSYFDLIADTK